MKLVSLYSTIKMMHGPMNIRCKIVFVGKIEGKIRNFDPHLASVPQIYSALKIIFSEFFLFREVLRSI